ncbi:MAG: hypothetical protein Q8920_09480, partial [Bacillota bacterium]|nr:hypothetical protein [Bacillota bacterium]
LFDGFIIKTYAEGGEEVALSSKEAIPLKEYSPLMSSVPGIPFRLDSIRIDVDEIQISTEKGTLLTWELPNGSVEDQGNFYKCREKTTVYWSPLTKDGALANQGKLIISAFKAGKEVIKAEISIKEISQAKYSAELLSLISKPSMSK